MPNGPTDIALMRRTNAMRGLWHQPGKPHGTYFTLTRLHETQPYAYGWYCDGKGRPIPGTPLVRLRLNAAHTAPDGYRRAS